MFPKTVLFMFDKWKNMQNTAACTKKGDNFTKLVA